MINISDSVFQRYMVGVKFVPFDQRPEWSDIVPVDVSTIGGKVFQIQYTDEYKQIFGYYRAVQGTEECSQRIFDLTTEAIMLNPADYALWVHRRKLINELNIDIAGELRFLTNLLADDPKVYQEWYHRMYLLELLADPQGEFDYIEEILQTDAKNYHAWQYRVWLRTYFAIWNIQELKMINVHISNDPYNNSAWSYRFQIIHNTKTFNDRETLNDEITYTIKVIELYVDNESSWNYLSGILPFENKEGRERVINWALKYLDKLDSSIEIQKLHRLAFDFIVHFYIDFTEFSSETTRKLQERLALILGESIDTIRKGYWEYILKD